MMQPWQAVDQMFKTVLSHFDKCPECGVNTSGTVSEGGCRWSLCGECADKFWKKKEAENND